LEGLGGSEDHRALAHKEGEMRIGQLHSGAILPDQIELVESVFDELLRARGLDRSSKEAELLAARLLGMFGSGIYDRDALRQMADCL